MKGYKEFNKMYIGSSDRAELTLRYFDIDKKCIECQGLRFGEDGSYDAYIINDEEVAIPEYYSLVFEKNIPWLDIIDDDSVIGFNNLENVKIYRAGMYGCIIMLNHIK